jgi:DNA polymerase-1
MDIIFDVESDGFIKESTKIHCISWQVVGEDKVHRVTTDDDITADLGTFEGADSLIGHNIVKFDIPLIQKFYPCFKPPHVLHDTLVYSRLIWPNIYDIDAPKVKKGKLPQRVFNKPHALESWGYRLGIFKGSDFKTTESFAVYTEEMGEYCDQDVRVTSALWNLILSKNYSEEALELERDFLRVIQRQETHGVKFNKDKAVELYSNLVSQIEPMRTKLKEIFPPEYINRGEFIPKRNNKTLGYVKGVPCTKIEMQEFNPNSRQQVANRLIAKYDWKPVKMTDGGQPQVDEKVLSTLQYPEAKVLLEYFTLIKLAGMVADGDNGWLRLEEDGRMFGTVNTMGTVTGRCSHVRPNLGQVPARGPNGALCRLLFEPDTGHVLVGCDADGLELRILAHYMNDKNYTKTILEGSKADGTDIHTVNTFNAGLVNRNDGKTFIYAYLYGAGDAKIGSIIGKGAKAGKGIKNKFLSNTPKLKTLRKATVRDVKTNGYIIGIDGRRLHSRSPHSALNLLFQSAGALAMKKALIFCDNEMQSRGYKPKGVDYEFVLNVHDEWQATVRPEIAEEFGKVSAESIKKAGEYFKLKCPLSGSYDIGTNWSETH